MSQERRLQRLTSNFSTASQAILAADFSQSNFGNGQAPGQASLNEINPILSRPLLPRPDGSADNEET